MSKPSEPKPTDLLQAGAVIACRYRVRRHVRSHPLGDLYRCDDETAGGVVLLQRLLREFAGPGVRDRLFDTRGSASMESEVIADILDYGEDIDGRPFVVTAWSDDASLDAVERPLSFVEAVTIVERVALALAPLHARRLVHGSIEPASVLVDDAREPSALLGFGLAPALDGGADKTRAMPLLVSSGYAAPEAIRGLGVGPAADVYALGILLWELIFGAVPFRGPTLRVLDAHLNRPLPAVELPFDAPASFEWVLRRMLAKSPADRFPDAGAVAEQLRDYAEAEPVVPRLSGSFAVLDTQTDVDVLAVRDEDDETVVFERVREGSLLMPDIRLHVEIVEDADTPPARPRRRRAPRIAAALAMVATLAVLGAGRLVSTPTEASARASFATATTRALSRASRVEPPPIEAFARAPMPTPTPAPVPAPVVPVVEAPEVVPGPVPPELGAGEFRALKRELYRRVGRRCIDGRVRRSLELAVRVGPSGEVEAASVVGEMGSTKLGRCAERQATRLEFPRSDEGGFYVYTLRLR